MASVQPYPPERPTSRRVSRRQMVTSCSAVSMNDFRELGRLMREKTQKDGPPPLSLHIVMGPGTPERLGNVMKTLDARIIAPIEIIARAV